MKIFQGECPSFGCSKCNFVHDLTLLGHRIKSKHHADGFDSQSLVCTCLLVGSFLSSPFCKVVVHFTFLF